jgi:Uma2 family endonuclease
MQQPRPADLTADAFIEWAMRQPAGRFELLRGEIVAMSPERVGHARVKKEVLKAFDTALLRAESGCEAFGDGMAVRIDESTVYEPDVTIRCGPKLPNDAVQFDDPLVVVEVVSPSSRGIDAGSKLADYFRLPSVRHYLVVQPETRRVTHHQRAEASEIATRILGEDATLALQPPGLTVEIVDFFATL